jgi:hypothetical protein
VFEDRELRKIFGPKREEEAGNWRRPHNEELHKLYCSPHIKVVKSWRIEWVGHVARMGNMRNPCNVLVR